MKLLSKYNFNIPGVVYNVEEEEEKVVENSEEKYMFWWCEPLPPDDERSFFPYICDDYVCSIRWMVSVRLLELPLWASKPPIRILGVHVAGSCERPEYTSIPFHKSPPNIFFTLPPRVGESLNIISMLSDCRDGLRRIGNTNHRVEPESLRGKYVLLFCVFVPARWLEYNTCDLCRLAILSHHLSLVNNFEIVIVPKMRKQWDDDTDAFHQLLSPFLGRLVVPFSDKVSRDWMCYFLSFNGPLTALLVGPDCKVLQDNVNDILSNHSIITMAGVPYFLPKPPQDKPSLPLSWLLNAKEGDPSFLLHNLNSNETISVAQLSKKLVGLYLFQVGDNLNSFHKVYNQCKDEGLDFEIVLVPMPLFSSIPPLLFEGVMLSEVRKHIPNTSWWVLPYDNCACVRLFNICQGLIQDRMITVGPDTRFFVEECGGEVAHHFGIQAYPFNREVVVQKYVNSAKAVTLESLLTFGSGSIDYLVRSGEKVPVASLRGKNVILYADSSIGYSMFIYNDLVIWCNEHKKRLSDFEVVFVYRDLEISMKCKDTFPPTETEFLVRPFDPEHSSFIRAHPAFFLGSDEHGNPVDGLKPRSLLAFGKDGYLHSLRPMNFDGSIDTYRFHCEYSSLREDIIDDIASEFDFMGGYQAQKPFDVVSLN